MKTKILIVDDEERIIKILSRILTEEGYEVAAAGTGEEGISVSRKNPPDVILMDLNLPGTSGIEAMRTIQSQNPRVKTIILTAYGTISSAVEAMKSGAYDYLTKPFDNDDLLLTIKRVEEHLSMQREITSLRGQLHDKYQFENIIGQSPKMKALFHLMGQVAETDATVLVQGESGTGKELIVRAIHHAGFRRDAPFITVNCGAIPHTLVESEFFGHEKGAFTDARQRRIGAFERADRGTLVLDEVGELPAETQVALLRVIEEKTITRVGGSEEIPVDVRILAATNKDLEKEVEEGKFRKDLFFRLNVFFLSIPPLRERKEDIPLLVDHFLEGHRKSFSASSPAISRQAVQTLCAYGWPGNVRELSNAIKSALIVCHGETILPCHLPLRIQGYPHIEGSGESPEDGLEAHTRQLMKDMEIRLIQEALKACAGNRTDAARLLKISRKTLFNKMQKLGLSEREDVPAPSQPTPSGNAGGLKIHHPSSRGAKNASRGGAG